MKKGFLIGAATAAHQVEGNNIHSDYWAMENMQNTSFNEPSGEACDHYNRYAEDIALLKAAGLNAYRFSVEWARIEPEEGRFDENEIEHYRKVLKCCRENGIEPIVTMQHFTSPVWLIRKGGWEAESTVADFARYCAKVVEELGEYLHYVVTINEANMGLQVAAIAERYKRQMMAAAKAGQKANVEGTAQIGMNFNAMMQRMAAQKAEYAAIFGTPDPQYFVSARTPEGDILVMRAHRAAKAAMKALKPELQVGLSLSLHDIQTIPGGEENAAKEWDEEFTHYLPYIRDDDFFGLQNYTRSVYGADGIQPAPAGAKLTQMDYENYPEALEHVIRRVYGQLPLPIIVTENGIAVSDDAERCAFVRTALQGVQNCLDDGVDLRGYCYWSLLDNFEWQKGFSMTFGLIAVDRASQERSPKGSLALLGSYTK